MGYNRRAHKIQNLRSKGISMAFVEQRANGRQVTLISCWPLLRLLIRGLGFDKKTGASFSRLCSKKNSEFDVE